MPDSEDLYRPMIVPWAIFVFSASINDIVYYYLFSARPGFVLPTPRQIIVAWR